MNNLKINNEHHKYSVALIGARGYVGEELIKLLDKHPKFELKLACSRNLVGQLVKGYSKQPIHYTDLKPTEIAQITCDIFILALPNGHADSYVKAIEMQQPQSIIIDLSADYRFDPSWYYSQPETQSQPPSAANTKRISNPGCYATAMQLAISPLRGYINSDIHCFGVSGYSGAGTSPSDKNDPQILDNNLLAYQLSEHIHEKEPSHILGKKIHFSPHVASFFRGIALTAHIPLDPKFTREALIKLFQQYYSDEKLVEVQKAIPQVTQVTHKHSALIGGFSLSEDKKYIALHIVLDNLLKGAATQAIQNLNIAIKLAPTTGINHDCSKKI